MRGLSSEVREERDSTTRVRDAFVGGRYRVVRELGMGAMGSVHLAELVGPCGFRKWVALKRIHGHLGDDEAIVRMFVDEARLVARLSHPNVAQVFDLIEDRGAYFIVMECLHGESLRDVVRRGEAASRPLARGTACAIVERAAEGLHAAHELEGGLVHRDVSPQNVVVTYSGQVKVVDFGVARWQTGAAATGAGVLKGKLAYMSPEQAAGESIDRRTDVFALGVVLWELTTGRRLFRGRNDLETLANVQTCDPPRPSAVSPGYPAALEAVVMRALAKEREARYATARNLARALRSLGLPRTTSSAEEELERCMRALFADEMAERETFLRRPTGAASVPPPAEDEDPTVISSPPESGAAGEEEDTTVTQVMPPRQSEQHAVPPSFAPPRTPTSPRLPPVVVRTPAPDQTVRVAAQRRAYTWALAGAAGGVGLILLVVLVWWLAG